MLDLLAVTVWLAVKSNSGLLGLLPACQCAIVALLTGLTPDASSRAR